MICELQIKLQSGPKPINFNSAHFIYEIERVCDSKDRYKLFEAYTKSIIHPINSGMTLDSVL